MQPTNLTSSIQVSEEMIEAGRKEVLRFEDRDDIREILPRIYLAMRSKDHSIAVDDVREALKEAEAAIIDSSYFAALCAIRSTLTAIGSQSK